MAAVVEDREEREPSVHVEEQIYDSFTGPEDQALMAHVSRGGMDQPRGTARRSRGPAACRYWGGGCCTRRRRRRCRRRAWTSYRADVARRLLADEVTVPWLTLPKAIRETDELLAGSTGAYGVASEGLAGVSGREV